MNIIVYKNSGSSRYVNKRPFFSVLFLFTIVRFNILLHSVHYDLRDITKISIVYIVGMASKCK